SLPAIASNNDAGGTEEHPKNPYIAVIAFDGDQIGKRLSGELMPDVKDVVADGLDRCVSGKRKLTPSYHAQFSEALANFSTSLSRRVVTKYKGLLVYAGGDDVLCVVPADKALDCAADLRAVFRGDYALLSSDARHYDFGITQPGFVLADEKYSLIVPGPSMDASCGIVIGHCKHPLQALVRESQVAERRAKSRYAKDKKDDYLGGAFALSLMKRSGEIIEWGAGWSQNALAVYRDFTRKTDEEQLSGRFPYALADLLKPYRLSEKPQVNLKPVIATEFEHIQSQQAQVKGTRIDNALTYLKELSEDRLEDFTNLFLASAFINRQRGDN
ncbi:MAG: type III-B CRISPR-associated protein Cas10/Cmr2, partial [Kiritimatiellaceae bacterium]|nr:type III-B CRISPR-associated protein Cas10/Cmr2 [Kiritimatiellaceae bacterium]